jgi:type IV pilus assembly protein PilV
MVRVYSDERGFTLVEFLVSIVILSVGLLGLLQSVNVAINHNMTNQLRFEGTQVADEEIAKELAKGSTTAGFEAISTTSRSYFVARRIPTSLNAFRNFSVTKAGTSITTNSKRVTIQVSWHYKKEHFTQSAASLITKAQQ